MAGPLDALPHDAMPVETFLENLGLQRYTHLFTDSEVKAPRNSLDPPPSFPLSSMTHDSRELVRSVSVTHGSLRLCSLVRHGCASGLQQGRLAGHRLAAWADCQDSQDPQDGWIRLHPPQTAVAGRSRIGIIAVTGFVVIALIITLEGPIITLIIALEGFVITLEGRAITLEGRVTAGGVADGAAAAGHAAGTCARAAHAPTVTGSRPCAGSWWWRCGARHEPVCRRDAI